MEYITTEEAGKRLGLSRIRIIALINDGRLPAQKVGRDWLIRPVDLALYKRQPKGNFKLTPQQIIQIKDRAANGTSPDELAREFNVTTRTIYRYIRK